MENSCRKKYKPSPKKWILASRYSEFRRNPALIPANAGLFHYAGNNPVRYIDPDGRFLLRQFFAGLFQLGGGICEEIGAAGIEVSTLGGGTGASIFFGLDGIYNITDGFCKAMCACVDVKWDGLLNTLTTETLVSAGVDREYAEAIGTFVDLMHDITDIVMTPNKVDIAKVLDKVSKVQKFFVINKSINNINAIHDGFTLLYEKIIKPIVNNAKKQQEVENE